MNQFPVTTSDCPAVSGSSDVEVAFGETSFAGQSWKQIQSIPGQRFGLRLCLCNRTECGHPVDHADRSIEFSSCLEFCRPPCDGGNANTPFIEHALPSAQRFVVAG